MNPTSTTRGLTLDAGALIALDQPSKAAIMQARLAEVRRRGGSICIPVGVIAQVSRGPRQVRLARLIKSADVDVAVMSLPIARAVGVMCATGGHRDVIDVHVALCARERHHAVVTSDIDDLARIDPDLPLIHA